MQRWFDEEEQLKYQLGVVYDESLAQSSPWMNASLPEMHEGYCAICYLEIDDTNSFSLDCKHTFCN